MGVSGSGREDVTDFALVATFFLGAFGAVFLGVLVAAFAFGADRVGDFALSFGFLGALVRADLALGAGFAFVAGLLAPVAFPARMAGALAFAVAFRFDAAVATGFRDDTALPLAEGLALAGALAFAADLRVDTSLPLAEGLDFPASFAVLAGLVLAEDLDTDRVLAFAVFLALIAIGTSSTKKRFVRVVTLSLRALHLTRTATRFQEPSIRN